MLGLGKGSRPLYVSGLLATALVGAFFVYFSGLNLYSTYETGRFFIFSILGVFILVNRALRHYETASGEIIWCSSSSLLRDFVLLSLVIFGIQMGKNLYAYSSIAYDPFGGKSFETTQIPEEIKFLFKSLFMALDIFSWIVKMVINGLLAQWVLVQFKLNLRPSFSAEKF